MFKIKYSNELTNLEMKFNCIWC